MLLPLCSVCFCPAGARQLLQLNHHQALLLPLGERCRAPPQWQDMPSLGKHPASPSPLPPRCGTAKLTFFSAPLGEPQHQNVALQKTQARSRAVPLGGLLHLPARGLELLWDSVGCLEPACPTLGARPGAPAAERLCCRQRAVTTARARRALRLHHSAVSSIKASSAHQASSVQTAAPLGRLWPAAPCGRPQAHCSHRVSLAVV